MLSNADSTLKQIVKLPERKADASGRLWCGDSCEVLAEVTSLHLLSRGEPRHLQPVRCVQEPYKQISHREHGRLLAFPHHLKNVDHDVDKAPTSLSARARFVVEVTATSRGGGRKPLALGLQPSYKPKSTIISKIEKEERTS